MTLYSTKVLMEGTLVRYLCGIHTSVSGEESSPQYNNVCSSFLPSPSSVTAPGAAFRCSSLPGPVADPLVSLVALACCCWPPEGFGAAPEGFDEVPDVLGEVDLDGDPEAFASVPGGFTAGLGVVVAASDDFDPEGAQRTRFSVTTLGLVFGLPRGLVTNGAKDRFRNIQC